MADSVDRVERGVFLCKCNGKISAALPLEELRAFLEAEQAGLEVVIADNLCQAEVMRDLTREHQVKPGVIGGCTELKTEAAFWDEPESCSCDPDVVGLVDILKETDSPYSPEERWSRVRSLLRSKVKRQEKFVPVPQKARRVRFDTPHGEMTRRDLLQSILPKYWAAPHIDVSRCAGERCRICRQACPGDAISLEARQLSIDAVHCQGCGACASVCPWQAVIYPNYSLPQLEAEIAGLLRDSSYDKGNRILAFSCRVAGQHPDIQEDVQHLPPNVFLVEVPCLAMIPGWLILRAFELGAQAVALVAYKAKCRLPIEESIWLKNVDFVQAVLHRLGVEPGRLSYVEGGDIAAGLRRVAEVVAGWSPISRRSLTEREEVSGPAISAVTIQGLAAGVGAPLRGTVSSGKVPFGSLTLDGRRCTACGICIPECPTRALTAVTAADSVKILFQQAHCVGCRQCAEICPERCLEVDRVLELDRLDEEPAILLEGDFVRCIWCGKPFAPKSMIEKVHGRIAAAGGNLSQLDKCPECRMKGKPAGAKRNGSGAQRDG